jgi:hypothetical protein
MLKESGVRSQESGARSQEPGARRFWDRHALEMEESLGLLVTTNE